MYDFPEPSQPSQCKFAGHQRARGSLKSISVLDRLLLTVPVWLQLSINPATALHILQREPPGVSKYTHGHSTLVLPFFISIPPTSPPLSCRPSWCVGLERPRGTCCVSVWPMTACPPSCSSLGSGRMKPVRALTEYASVVNTY